MCIWYFITISGYHYSLFDVIGVPTHRSYLSTLFVCCTMNRLKSFPPLYPTSIRRVISPATHCFQSSVSVPCSIRRNISVHIQLGWYLRDLLDLSDWIIGPSNHTHNARRWSIPRRQTAKQMLLWEEWDNPIQSRLAMKNPPVRVVEMAVAMHVTSYTSYIIGCSQVDVQ